MTRPVKQTRGLDVSRIAAIALLATGVLAGHGAAHAVTRSASEVETLGGGPGTPDVAAKPPAVAFKPSIKVLPDDGIGFVIQSRRGCDGGVSWTLRLGGVDLHLGPAATK
jgi:hypothetical protein